MYLLCILVTHRKGIERCGSVSRALDWVKNSCYFETHRRRGHCHGVVSLKKKLYPLLSTGSIQEDSPDMTEKMLTGT